MMYQTGDGRTFASLKEACLHAKAVHAIRGVVVSVEEVEPAIEIAERPAPKPYSRKSRLQDRLQMQIGKRDRPTPHWLVQKMVLDQAAADLKRLEETRLEDKLGGGRPEFGTW